MSGGSGLLLRSVEDHSFPKAMRRGRGGAAQLREEVAGLRSHLQCKENFCAQLIEENRQLLANVQLQKQEHDAEIDRVKREAAQVAQRLLDERLCLRAAVEELQEKLVAAGEALRTKQAQLLLAERRVGRGHEETKVLKRYTRSIQQQQAQTEEEARQLRSSYVDLKKSIQTFASGLAASKFVVDGECDYDALVRTLSDGIRKLEVDVLSLDARLFKKGLLSDVSPEILFSSYNDRMVPSSEVEKAVKGRKLWQNKYDKLERELVQGKETLEKVKAELDQRNRRVMQLRVELSKRKSLSEDIHNLMQRNRELQATVEELQKERDNLRKWKANQAIRPPSRIAAAASPAVSPATAAHAAAALASSSPQRRGAAAGHLLAVTATPSFRPSGAAAGSGVAAAGGPRGLSRSSSRGLSSPVQTRRVTSTLPLPSPVVTSKSYITLTPPSASAAALAAEQKRRKSSKHSAVGAFLPSVTGSAAVVHAPASLAAVAALPTATAAAVASAVAAASSSAAGGASAAHKGRFAGRTLSPSPFASPSSVLSPREEGIYADRRATHTLRSPRARAAAFQTAAPQYTSTAAMHASSPSSSVATVVVPRAFSPPETVPPVSSAGATTSADVVAVMPAPTLVAAATPGRFAAASVVRTSAAAVTRTVSAIALTPRQATAATFLQQTKAVAVEVAEEKASVALAAEDTRVMKVAQYATVTPMETIYTHSKDIAAVSMSAVSRSSSEKRGGTSSDPASPPLPSTLPTLAAALPRADGGTLVALPSPTEPLPLEDTRPAASRASATAAAAAARPSSPLRASVPPAAAATCSAAFPGSVAQQPYFALSAHVRRKTRPEGSRLESLTLSAGPESSRSRASSSGSEAKAEAAITDRSLRAPASAAGSSVRAAAGAERSSRAVAAADSGTEAAAKPAERGRALPREETGKQPPCSGVVEVAKSPDFPSATLSTMSAEPRRFSPLHEGTATSLSQGGSGEAAWEVAAAPKLKGGAGAFLHTGEGASVAAAEATVSRAGAVAAFFGAPQSDSCAATSSGKAAERKRSTEGDTKKDSFFSLLHAEEAGKRRASSRLLHGGTPERAANGRGSSSSVPGASRTVLGPVAAAALRGVSHRSWGGEGSLGWPAADSSSRGAAAADTRSLGTARSCSSSSIAFFAQEAQHQSADKSKQGHRDAAATGRRRDRKERHQRKSTIQETPGGPLQEGKRATVTLLEKDVGMLGGRSTSSSSKRMSRVFPARDAAAQNEDAWAGMQESKVLETPLRLSWSRRNSSGGDGGPSSSSSSKYVTASEGEQAFSTTRAELQATNTALKVHALTPPDLGARKPPEATTVTAAVDGSATVAGAAGPSTATDGATGLGISPRSFESAEHGSRAAGAAAEGTSPTELREREGEPTAMQEKSQRPTPPPTSTAVQQLLRKVALKQATAAVGGWGDEGRPLSMRAAVRRKAQRLREDSSSGSSGVATPARQDGEALRGGETLVLQHLEAHPAPNASAGSPGRTHDKSSRCAAETGGETEEEGIGERTALHAGAAPGEAAGEPSHSSRFGRTSEPPSEPRQSVVAGPAAQAATVVDGASEAASAQMEKAAVTVDAGPGEKFPRREQRPQQEPEPGVQQQGVHQAKQQPQQASFVRAKTLFPKARPLRMRNITQQHA